MSDKFSDMVKLPKEPAARALAHANVRLDTNLEAPASAGPEEVLIELDAKGAWLDILRVFAVMLPARERVWWGCLAGRDWIEKKGMKETPSLLASEAWVRQPNEDNRMKARATLDTAYVDDDTTNLAVSVLYGPGTLGPGDLAEHPAPAGGAELTAMAMNLVALGEHSDMFEPYRDLLIDRAIDIARGGNGRVEMKTEATEET